MTPEEIDALPFRDERFSRRFAVVWMRAHAVDGRLKASVRGLAKTFGWSPSAVQRLLTSLRSRGEVMYGTDPHGTFIIVMRGKGAA